MSANTKLDGTKYKLVQPPSVEVETIELDRWNQGNVVGRAVRRWLRRPQAHMPMKFAGRQVFHNFAVMGPVLPLDGYKYDIVIGDYDIKGMMVIQYVDAAMGCCCDYFVKTPGTDNELLTMSAAFDYDLYEQGNE